MTGILAATGCIKNATQTVYDYTAAASGTLTIPGGFTTCVLEVWGAGGGGGRGATSSGIAGGGGGGGGYSRSSLTVTGQSGKTILYTVGLAGVSNGGNGGFSNAYGGTFSMTTMTANGGTGGQLAGAVSGNGTGGTASGGTAANTTGNNGSGGVGGAAIAGNGSLTAGAGGDGGEGGINIPGEPVEPPTNGLPGTDGRVRFVFS